MEAARARLRSPAAVPTALPPAARMPRHIALLRAINVGGHNVPMARLRALFESMQLGRVETFIASGNVLFDAPSSDAAALEARIEDTLEQALGYAVATFVRSPAELAAVAAHDAFPGEDEGHALSIAFLKEAPGRAAAEALAGRRTPVDDFRVHGREVYWLCRSRVSDSKFSGAVLERVLGAPATFRNVTTVRKLAALHAPTS